MDAPSDLNGLPDGLTARSMTLADVDIVTELVAACELHHDGVIEIDREDIEVDWARPAYDLATESIGVFDGDRLVAEAELFKGKRAEINVHPDALGRGIGTALLGWTEDLAARQGSTRVSQTTTDANDRGRGHPGEPMGTATATPPGSWRSSTTRGRTIQLCPPGSGSATTSPSATRMRPTA